MKSALLVIVFLLLVLWYWAGIGWGSRLCAVGRDVTGDVAEIHGRLVCCDWLARHVLVRATSGQRGTGLGHGEYGCLVIL